MPGWRRAILLALAEEAGCRDKLTELATVGSVAWSLSKTYAIPVHMDESLAMLNLAMEAQTLAELLGTNEYEEAAAYVTRPIRCLWLGLCSSFFLCWCHGKGGACQSAGAVALRSGAYWHGSPSRLLLRYAAQSPKLTAMLGAAMAVAGRDITGTPLDGANEFAVGDPLAGSVMCLHPATKVVFVSTHETVQQLRAALGAGSGDGDGDGSSAARVDMVGVDCEWRHPRPISTVQLAVSPTEVYLVDFVGADKATQAELRGVLCWLFGAENIVKVGFGFKADWGRLRLLLGPDAVLHNLLDYQLSPPAGCAKSGGAAKKGDLISLSFVVAYCFGRGLDKREQRSNWDRRPLRPSQTKYAALDAAVLLMIREHLSSQ